MTRRNQFPTLLAAAGLLMLSACADLNVTTNTAGARSQDSAPYANAANPLGDQSKVDPLAPSPG